MALGLFSFVMVALLGLMQVAFGGARSSLDAATASQLADGLAARYGQTNFASLPAQSNYYFDDVGKEVESPSDAIYSASVEQTNAGTSNLMRVKITVTRGPNPAGGKKFSFLLFNKE